MYHLSTIALDEKKYFHDIFEMKNVYTVSSIKKVNKLFKYYKWSECILIIYERMMQGYVEEEDDRSREYIFNEVRKMSSSIK